MLNLTQSWLGSTPSLSGSVPFTQSNALEFFNGELSGSNYVVTNGELSNYEVITPIVYSTSSFKAAYTYPTNFFTSGVDQGFPRVTSSISNYINYDFKFEKTYYLSFTASVANGTSSDGINMVIVNSDLSFAKGITSGSIFQQIQQGAINLKAGTNIINNYEVTELLPKIYFLNINGVANTPIPFNDITITDFTVKEVTLSNPDGFVIENNIDLLRPNNKHFDVDFSSNQIIAVNSENIISASRGTGSATPSTVPQSNYTIARSANPRYNGCSNTSPDINIGLGNNLPVIEQLGNFALVYKNGGKSDNLIPNNIIFFDIVVGVDEEGNLFQPQSSSIYYWNSLNSFGKNNIIQILTQNSQSISQSSLMSLQGEKTVYSLFEYPNSFLTTTSASVYNIFEYTPLSTGSITIIDNINNQSTIVNHPYWATSSETPFTITSSISSSSLGFYLSQSFTETSNWVQIETTATRKGLDNPIDNILPKIGDIFMHPNILTPFIVTDVSIIGNEFRITFNNPIPSPYDSGNELDKFIFIRNYQNLNRININTTISIPTSQINSGIIFPQKTTKRFIDNISDITSNLISKNLL
jgi:hypothetical protein